MLDGRWYVGGAGFVKGGDEGVVGGCEAVVGGVTTSAVIELDDVPAVAADRLRDVEIFFHCRGSREEGGRRGVGRGPRRRRGGR